MNTRPVENKIFSDRSGSALKIQSLWRGYRIRRNLLPKKLYDSAIQFITKYPTMTDVPKASSGVTDVFLPNDLPLVFKALGEQRSKKRFFTMWKTRDLCLKSGYKHLRIPKAYPYAKYNIEERFPVDAVKQREQIALYEENKDKFSKVVKEFTGFLCKCIFPDILTFSHPYVKKDKIPLVRCDNIPLLINNDVGEIALIDLGGHQIREHKLSVEEALECAKTAIFIFPYHFDVIIEVVYSFCPEIYSELSLLKEISQQTVTQYKSIYADHKEFILTKSRSDAQIFCTKNVDVINKIKLLIDDAVESQKEEYILNDTKSLETVENIVGQVLVKLVEGFNKKILDLNTRVLTINCDEVESSHSSNILILILNKLISLNEICYANLYFNRSGKLFLRIHY